MEKRDERIENIRLAKEVERLDELDDDACEPIFTEND